MSTYTNINPDLKDYLYYYNSSERDLRTILLVKEFSEWLSDEEQLPGIFEQGQQAISAQVLHEVYGVPLEVQVNDTLVDTEGNFYVITEDYIIDEFKPYNRRGFWPSILDTVTDKFAYKQIRCIYRSSDTVKHLFKNLHRPPWQDEPFPSPSPANLEGVWIPPGLNTPQPDYDRVYDEQFGAGDFLVYTVSGLWLDVLKTRPTDGIGFMENHIMEGFTPIPGLSMNWESKGINDSYEDSADWIYSQLNNHHPWRRIMRHAWHAGLPESMFEMIIDANGLREIRAYGYVDDSPGKWARDTEIVSGGGGVKIPIPVDVIIGLGAQVLGLDGDGNTMGIRIDKEVID